MKYRIALLFSILIVLATPAASQSNEETSKAEARRTNWDLAARLDLACAKLARLNAAVPACDRTKAAANPNRVIPNTQIPYLYSVAGSPLRSLNNGDARMLDPSGTVGPMFVMLRQNEYDELSFASPPRPGEIIQGASISYTNDQNAHTQTAPIQGLVGLSAYNWQSPYAYTYCSTGPSTSPRQNGNDRVVLGDFGVGGFVLGDGTFDNPTKATDRSALRGALDADFVLCNTPVFAQQDLQFIPYAQTDFLGRASIGGFDALWEPYSLDQHIGGRLDALAPKLIGHYFRVIGEANVFQVDNPGLTNFMPHTAYALLGATGQVRAVLFENNPSVPPALCGRISLIGTAQYLEDVISPKQPVYLYGAEIDYNLSGQGPSTVNCRSPAPQVTTAGAATISFSYNQGTDIYTLLKQNVYKVALKIGF